MNSVSRWWARPTARTVRAVRLGWTLGVLTSSASLGLVAAQPAANLSLTWEAPVECPNRDEVHARVDGLLGGDASASSVSDVEASGRVERVPNGFRLELRLAAGDRPTFRELRAGTCDELAGAAAIAIALLARSGAESSDSTAPHGTSASAGAAAKPAKAPPESRPRETASSKQARDGWSDATEGSDRVYFLVDAPLAVVGWGALPSAGMGIGAAVGLKWKVLRIVAGGELWRAQTLEESGLSLRFNLQSARADTCLTQPLGGVEVGPCAGVALERVSGRGIASRTFTPRSSDALWISGTGGVVAAVPLPGFPTLRILGQASVRVATRRPRFVIDQLGPVHQAALAAPKLDFGCEWIF